MTDALSRVMTGRVWEAFCDQLKAAGQIILAPQCPATELDRAEGWRYLSRLTRIALEMMLEYSDPDFPVFFQASHPTAKLGADNPNNNYYNATIRGDREYRIYGERGGSPFLSFGTKANRYAIDGSMASTGELDDKTLLVDPDGTFQVTLSQKRQPGNWLPIAADSSMVILRETFLSNPRERRGQFAIERVSRGPSKPPALSAALLDAGLTSASAFVNRAASTFVAWTELFRRNPNTLLTLDQTPFLKAGGEPDIFYLHGYWQLATDEALIIDTEVPSCHMWNIQIDNYWMESLDYRYLPIWINKDTALYNADGSVSIVLAGTNPGVPNFLDTGGHTSGTMLLRWTRAASHPVPKCRVVKLREIARNRPLTAYRESINEEC